MSNERILSDNNIVYKPEELQLAVNRDRAFEVVDTILEAYDNRQTPFENMVLPTSQEIMPKLLQVGTNNNLRGTKEHAMFLLNSCLFMRGGAKTIAQVKNLSKVFDTRTELFDCATTAQFDEEELRGIIKESNLRFQKRAPEWITNSQRMLERYGGDPRKIYDESSTFDEVLIKTRNSGKGRGFMGFQKKMVSMVTYMLECEGLINIDHYPPYPPPIDFHFMRIALANEMVTANKNELSSKEIGLLEQVLIDFYIDYLTSRSESTQKITDAVWLWSEQLCKGTPGNMMTEPEGVEGHNGRSTIIEPKQHNWLSETTTKQYKRTCGRCALERLCVHNVPNAQYYVQGKLVIEEDRKIPLQTYMDL